LPQAVSSQKSLPLEEGGRLLIEKQQSGRMIAARSAANGESCEHVDQQYKSKNRARLKTK
jgi:hypothetical protein